MTPASAPAPLTHAQAAAIADEQIAWFKARGDRPEAVYWALWRPLPGVVGWGTVRYQIAAWLRRNTKAPRRAA